MEYNSLPMGFTAALAQNPEAMRVFSNLPEDKRSEILQNVHRVSSKEEMRSLVNSLNPRP